MNDNVVVAVIAAVLGAPFLNFLLSLARSRVDKDNVIAQGAGVTVAAMQEALMGLRGELNEVWEDLQETRQEQEEANSRHQGRLRELEERHRREMTALRSEHAQQIRDIKQEYQRQIAELEARLAAYQSGSGNGR